MTTQSIVLDGDYNQVVGQNKQAFLQECTTSLSSGARAVQCVDVRPGSIIVDVRGEKDAVAAAVLQVKTTGLALPSFPKIFFQVAGLYAFVYVCMCVCVYVCVHRHCPESINMELSIGACLRVSTSDRQSDWGNCCFAGIDWCSGCINWSWYRHPTRTCVGSTSGLCGRPLQDQKSGT